MTAKKHTFRAVIQDAGGGGAYVEIPFDVEAAFGSKRPRVKAVIAGVPYRGSLVRMGSECHILGVLKAIRARAGKDVGDAVDVSLEADLEPRVVQVPPELAQALQREPAARARFDSLSYSHQREYVGFILEAKREETRAKRVAKTVELLKSAKK
jgi:hypothetical protein